MKTLTIGVSHRTAPVELRERLAFSEKETPEALARIIALEHVREAALVSTCNRVEIYAASDRPDEAAARIKEFLADRRPVSYEEIENHAYEYIGEDAVKHLYRVCAGLDSMVLGEPQILGQMKDSYRVAAHANSTGVILNKMFHKAFQAAKRIRTETRVGNYAVSVAGTAVELAAKIFGELSECSALLVGAGNMGELTAQHLVGAGVSEILITNRTYETAERLAGKFGGSPVRFDELDCTLPRADIIIATTGAPRPVISYRMVHDALKARKHKPVFLIDIAVPRDVEPKVNRLEGAYLYDIDDLRDITEVHRRKREQEAAMAEVIVAEEVAKFRAWQATLDVVPTVICLRSRFEEVARHEVQKALDSVPEAGEKERSAIELLGHNIVQKLLHEPTTMLKRCAENGYSEMAEACRSLFNLSAEAPEEQEEDGEDAARSGQQPPDD